MFSIKESIMYGWEKTKKHMELALYSTLLILAISWLAGGLSSIGLIILIFMIIVNIGYTKIFLKMNDGENPKFSEIFDEYKTFWRYLGTCMLLILIIVSGLVLFIIPGIFWAVRFAFASLIVIDTKLGPKAALKESWAITKGSFWKILWFCIISSFANFLGAVLAGVGLLVTIPVTTFAFIYFYRWLSQKKAGLATTSPQVV
ncbi:MAG: hypothetical protein AAB446_01535 [Patescibacteria group bacterium]